MIVNSFLWTFRLTVSAKGTTNAIREFVSKVKQSMGALKNLNQPADSWDTIIIVYCLENWIYIQTRHFKLTEVIPNSDLSRE